VRTIPTFENNVAKFRVAITGSGSATPVTSLGNQALSQVVETSDEWITTDWDSSRRLATESP